MDHQEHLSPPPVQETSQEDVLFPSEEQLEEITGAGLIVSKGVAEALIGPKLVRTPSGKVARNNVDVARAFIHTALQGDSRLNGQYIQGIRQQDGTYHMLIHPKVDPRASVTAHVQSQES